MSVSDPLLKELKGYILKFRMEDKVVDDYHGSLPAFCETLECILRKGLKQTNSIFGVTRRDYWGWVETLTHGDRWLNPKISMIVSKVQACKKVNSVIGRGRLFIRLALQHKSIIVFFHSLFKDVTDLLHNWYDAHLSILGDEILAEIFMSLLAQVEEVNFKLNLDNATFLDESWLLPVFKNYEFVPCDALGIQIQYVDGRPIAVHIRKGGVAEEDGKIEIGDILDEIHGECTREMKIGKMTKLLKQNQGYPVPIAVIKCHQLDGSIYPPISMLLRKVGKDIASLQRVLDNEEHNKKKLQDQANGKKPAHALLPEDESDEMPVHSAEEGATYNLKYLGTVSIGENGGVDQVEGAIGKLLDKVKAEEVIAKPVILEMGEKDVLTIDASTREVLLTHSYTEISSCGRRTDCVEYFCYIAGETTCTLAKKFLAYMFLSNSNEESKTILCTIAQGFNRTHWFV